MLNDWSLRNGPYDISLWRSGDSMRVCRVASLVLSALIGICVLATEAHSSPHFCYDELPPSSDFKINDDTSFSTDWDNYPAVSIDGQGGKVVAWTIQDESSGESKVLFQRLDEQNSLKGCAAQVNDDTLPPIWYQGVHLTNPQVVGNNSGKFVIVWSAYQAQQGHLAYSLVFQLFDSEGSPIGKNVEVDRTYYPYGYPFNYYSAAAMAPSGEFMIVWLDDHSDVCLKRFLANGDTGGAKIQLADSTSWYGSPAMAIDNKGGFIAAWCNRRSDSVFGQMQRLDSLGLPMGTLEQFSERVSVGGEEGAPALACDSTGAGVVVWTEPVPGHYRLLSQRFDSLGELVDSNSLVAELDSNYAARFPSVAVHEDGGYAVAWSKGVLNNHDVYLRHFDAFGAPVDSVRVVNDVTIKEQYYPVICRGPHGQEAVVWEDERTYRGRPDVYVQQFDSAGLPVGSNRLINRGETHQYYPSVACGSAGRAIVAWTEARYRSQDNQHVYYQCFGPDGVPAGANRDLGAGHNPYVAMATTNESIVVWTYGFVYAEFIDQIGTSLGARPISTPSSLVGCPLAARAGGHWVVAWSDSRSGFSDVYGRILDSVGQPIGNELRLDDSPDGNQFPCSITSDLDGSFIIGWTDRRDGGVCSAYLRRFDSLGQAIGAGFTINDSIPTVDLYGPFIGGKHKGSFLACWLDSRDGTWSIFGQRVDSMGNLIGSNFKINEGAGTVLDSWFLGLPLYWHPVVGTTSTGVSLIAWPSFGADSTDEDIWAQWLDENGNAIGQNFKLPDPVFGAALQRAPALAAGENTALAVWMDDRRGTGLDIFGRKTVEIPTDVAEEPGEESLPPYFDLVRNYPNPFNPSTSIEYSVPTRAHVTIEIYNVLGQRVTTLVDETKSAGNYKAEWNGTDVAGKTVSTGVYLYRFKAGDFVETKKMVLLK
jgi:hypothetical protein